MISSDASTKAFEKLFFFEFLSRVRAICIKIKQIAQAKRKIYDKIFDDDAISLSQSLNLFFQSIFFLFDFCLFCFHIFQINN